MTEAGGLGRVVGDEKDGAAGEEPGGKLLHVGAGLRVEGGEGLVEEDHGPILHQRARKGGALALAAGEGARAAVGAGAEADAVDERAGAGDLAALDHHLEALEAAARLPRGGIGVLALATETAASLHAMDYRGAPRLRALLFGAEDLSADLGISPRDAAGAYPAPVAAARAATLLGAAAAGVPALDTPWPDPRDPDGLAREAEAAARDGFAGKLCIHPAQVGPVNAAFTPSEAQVAWARKVRDGFAARPGAGVFALDGKMVDKPHLKLAERILASL